MSNEITTHNGLKMEILSDGKGESPKLGDVVSAHYEIWFGEGVGSSEFDYINDVYKCDLKDSTYEDRPFSGPVKFVIGRETPKDDIYARGDSIKGLDQAFLDMRVGEKRKLFIPHELAYGEEGASSFHTFHGFRTPPFQNLNMTVELVEIENSQEASSRHGWFTDGAAAKKNEE